MTVLDRPAEAPPQNDPPQARQIWPARVFAVCLALVTLSFLQDPGRVAADTKLDLTVNPWGLLGRSLHLWDPVGFFGQLQNQAYGYLWPMGPFFGVGHTLGIPVWIIQRAWWALILVAAFLGMYALLKVLRVGSGWPQILGGLAYALAVRPQSGIGAISVEILPMAMAPWVLVPLVRASRQGNVARGAALSALAVTLAGGVNAVAAAAVLPLAVWWLITLEPGPRRRQLWIWWPAMALLAILWWLIPLVLLGKYSPPFLDWIESANFTTSVTDPTSVLRGADHWLAYLGSASVWKAGWALATNPVLIIATGVVAAAGVAGLAMRSLPHRTFLIGGTIAGLVLVTLGHTGVLSGLGSEQIQAFLDGAGAPLRNVHKFDLVLRIPLVVAFCHLLTAVWPSQARPRWKPVLTAVLVACLVASWWPTLTGQLTRGRSYIAVPDYWQQTAEWLDENADPGRALIVPGASFGEYLWGRAQDEPLQAYGRYPWGLRDAVPLSSAGNIRMLDAVEARLESGYGGPGLAEYLNRMGVRYLVVRNDIYAADAPPPSRIHQALENSPGVIRVARIGDGAMRAESNNEIPDEGLRSAYPAVEIYEVYADDAPLDPRVTLRPAGPTMEVDGGPEALLPMADAGGLGNRAAVLSGDVEAAGLAADAGVVTDTDRRREITFGYMRSNESPTMTADQPFEQQRAVHDYRVTGDSGDTVALPGLQFGASSSAADVDAVHRLPRGATPSAAMDGALDTWWTPGVGDETQTYWEVVYPRATDVGPATRIALRTPNPRRDQELPVRVTTENGAREASLRSTAGWQDLPVPAGPTSWVRIDLLDSDHPLAFGIREVRLPGEGVNVLKLPPGRAGDAILLTARPGDASDCVATSQVFRCSDSLGQFSSDRPGLFRLVDVPSRIETTPRILVAPRDASAVSAATQRAAGMDVRTSSSRTTAVAGSALAAFDRDPDTAWQAAADDENPTLSVTLPEPQVLRGVRLIKEIGLNASAPLAIQVRVGDNVYKGFTNERGMFVFPAQTADKVTVTFETTNPVRISNDGGVTTLPLGVSEMVLVGADDLRRELPADSWISLPCGAGPDIIVDGDVMSRTKVTGRVGQIMTGQMLQAKACSAPVTLPAGEHRIDVRSSETFQPLVAAFAPEGAFGATPRVVSPRVITWDAASRTVDVPAAGHEQVLEVAENYNPGWQARLGDSTLTGVRVDGWKQAFLVPAGAGGEVTIDYAPDGTYRWGLLAGLLAGVAIVILAIRPPRLRERPAVASREWPRFTTVALAAGVLLALGPWGLLVFGLAVLALRKVPPPVPAFAGVVIAVTVPAILGFKPGSAGVAVQGCAVAVALAAIAVSLVSARADSDGSTSGSTESPAVR